MKFSFIVPVYNTEEYLVSCIESVLQQTCPDWEMLLIDDGSPDNAGEICDTYAKKYPQIRCIHQPNGGLSHARNTGIRNATGEYLIFLDSDDCWIDAEALTALDSYCDGVDCVAFGAKRFTKEQQFFAPEEVLSIPDPISGEAYIKAALLKKYDYPWYAWRYAFRRDWWIEQGFQFQEGVTYEDVRLIWLVLLKANAIRSLSANIYGYRLARRPSITSQITYNGLQQKLNSAVSTAHEIKRDSSIDSDTKALLLENMACVFYAIIPELYNLNSSERSKLLEIMNQNTWLTRYSVHRPQVYARFFISLFGVRPLALVLHSKKQLTHMLSSAFGVSHSSSR